MLYHEVGISSWFRNVAQWFLILFDISFHRNFMGSSSARVQFMTLHVSLSRLVDLIVLFKTVVYTFVP